MQIIHSKTRHFKPEQESLAEYLSKETLPRAFLLILLYVGIILAFIASFIVNTINISLYLYVMGIISFFTSLTLYLYQEKKDTKEAIIANEANKEYLICLGTEVKKFYGDAVKSSKANNNKIRPLLINAETMKRHFLCMATIGAGKSVLI